MLPTLAELIQLLEIMAIVVIALFIWRMPRA